MNYNSLNMARDDDAKPFGWSLLLDLYDCEAGLGDKKEDLQICYDFLDKLPGLIGMKKQGPPILIVTDAKLYPDKAGLSGWVALVESGIQIHTLIPTRFITIDVYSCRKFDPDLVLYVAKMSFSIKNDSNIEKKFLKRGANYFRY
jgi:S-adenosylmethionine/arginine decarboxylase-like enzyme